MTKFGVVTQVGKQHISRASDADADIVRLTNARIIIIIIRGQLFPYTKVGGA